MFTEIRVRIPGPNRSREAMQQLDPSPRPPTLCLGFGSESCYYPGIFANFRTGSTMFRQTKNSHESQNWKRCVDSTIQRRVAAAVLQPHQRISERAHSCIPCMSNDRPSSPYPPSIQSKFQLVRTILHYSRSATNSHLSSLPTPDNHLCLCVKLPNPIVLLGRNLPLHEIKSSLDL